MTKSVNRARRKVKLYNIHQVASNGLCLKLKEQVEIQLGYINLIGNSLSSKQRNQVIEPQASRMQLEK